MNTYKKAVAVRRQKQSKINSRIKAAMSGLPSHTAKLNFDLTDRDTNKKIDVPRNARIKAIAIVSDLLDSFGLPSKAKLNYLGTVKKATTKDGDIKDGILKVGAVISTLLGHKIAIDVPVIVRDKSLLEPAVFFYDGSPFVLCKQAIDQLIKRGTLDKAIAERRNLYSPPLMEKWLGIDHEPARTPIINKDHMFNPGSRNPWKFRRYSQKNVMVDCPECTGAGSSSATHGEGTFEIPCENCKGSGNIEVNPSDIIEGKDTWTRCPDCGEYTQHDQCVSCQQSGSSDVEGARLSPHAEEQCKQCGYSMPANEAGCRQCGAPRQACIQKKQAKDKKPRERTNIDTPTEFPEVWKGDLPQQVLDPAERSREDLFGVGQAVKLSEDFEARERGGGQVVVPSGERGKVVRDMKGDGLCLMVNFPDMDISAIVPKRFLKLATQEGSNHPFDKQARLTPGVYSIVLPDFPETGWTLFVDPSGNAVLQYTRKTGAEIIGSIYPNPVQSHPGIEDVIAAAIETNKDEMVESVADMQQYINSAGIKYDLESEFNEQTQLREQEYGGDKEGISERELENPWVTSGEPSHEPEIKSKCQWCLSEMEETAGTAQGEVICQKCVEWAKANPGECTPEQLKDLGATRTAATTEQVKHEIREMLREGYTPVDIIAAVKEKYPEHAVEVLKNLS